MTQEYKWWIAARQRPGAAREVCKILRSDIKAQNEVFDAMPDWAKPWAIDDLKAGEFDRD